MNFHLCSADCIRHCEHDNSLFIVVAIVDRAAFVLQVFHCTSSSDSDSDDNQFQVVVYLLVLYNYLIYNYYYTQTHIQIYTERAGAWQRNAAAQWVHSGLCCHTVFTFVSLATVHVIQLDSLWLTLSHAPPSLLHCLPPPLPLFSLYLPPSTTLSLFLCTCLTIACVLTAQNERKRKWKHNMQQR